MIPLSVVGAKAQVTLPKEVRKALKVKEKEDMVGFIIEGNTVIITRVEPVPSSDPFTPEEWTKIKALAKKKPKEIFRTSKESLAHLRKMLHGR